MFIITHLELIFFQPQQNLHITRPISK